MSSEQLVIIGAGLLSIVFTYFPALAKWSAEKDGTTKRQIMAVWLLIVTVGIFALSCIPALGDLVTRLDIAVACSAKSAQEG